MRDSILRRIHRTAEDIAVSAGARARVEILDSNPVMWNDATLTARIAPSLARVVGPTTSESAGASPASGSGARR